MFNFKEYRHSTLKFDFLVSHSFARDYIYNSFIFENTKEGFDFWYGINDKWMKYYHNVP